MVTLEHCQWHQNLTSNHYTLKIDNEDHHNDHIMKTAHFPDCYRIGVQSQLGEPCGHAILGGKEDGSHLIIPSS